MPDCEIRTTEQMKQLYGDFYGRGAHHKLDSSSQTAGYSYLTRTACVTYISRVGAYACAATMCGMQMASHDNLTRHCSLIDELLAIAPRDGCLTIDTAS